MYSYSFIVKRVSRPLQKSAFILVAFASLFIVQVSQATTVQFQTVMGDFEVNLYDKSTPKTVENFLAYVKSDAYKDVVIHRAIKDFVVQAGGYKFEQKLPLVLVTSNPAVINEPVFSNRRGTIAMAKLGTDPNSATNQFFFSLKDNSENLDQQNGGFTVFGEVTGNGMGIIDSIVNLNIFNFKSPFDSIPLQKYTSTDAKNNLPLTYDNLVVIRNIVVLDADIDTANKLTPAKNIYLSSASSVSKSSRSNIVVITSSSSNSSLAAGGTKSSGGGAINSMELLVLLMCLLFLYGQKHRSRQAD
jgi:peptidyl-prolyl cis-trans isomerase A (cyclophilin A)